MPRKLLVNIHLYLAAFLGPMTLLIVLSGGLYLFGIKGHVDEAPAIIKPAIQLNFKSASLAKEVKDLLTAEGLNINYEYLKVKGQVIYTRPTSRDHYALSNSEAGVKIVARSPDLQAAIIELHKGHGPKKFKIYQKILETASGKQTVSEELGHQEFVIIYKTFEPLGPNCLIA